MTEAEFQRQVTEVAELLGWSWAHFRPAQTARGWRTPVSGPLGKGFPDLVLVRPRDHRYMLVELKADKGKLTPDQAEVHRVLISAGVPVHVWRPTDFNAMVMELT